MKRAAAVTMVVGSACLASCFFKPDRPGGATGDAGTDAAADASVGACMGSVVWGTPRQLTELAGVGKQQHSPWLSKDKSELWFTSVDTAAQTLWHATRNGSAWGSATRIDDLGNFTGRAHFVVSDDGLSAWYSKMQSDENIYTASRAHRTDPWITDGLASFSVDGTSVNEEDPAPSGDGKTMVFTESNGGGGLPGDLMITTRGSAGDPWSMPTALSQYNTSFDECCAALSEDGNTLLFSTNKSNDYTIYVATRTSTQAAFGTAALLPHQISGNDNYDPVLARDGLTIVFTSGNGAGSDRLYEMQGSCAQ